jgi:hypothetical protein
MLAASHSHASVEMNALNRKNVLNNKNIGIFDERLLVFTADRIAQAILEADKNYKPVAAGVGSMQLPGMNRNRRGDETTDDEMTILRIDAEDKKPWVVFVNYTAHPTFSDEHTMVVSADWPGYLQRNIEGFLGAETMCMYSNGAEGDQAPADAQGPSEFAKMEDYGRKLAAKALELIPQIQTAPDAELEYSMTMLKLPPRAAPPALLQEAGPEYGITEENVGVLLDALVPESSYLGVLRVGDFLAVSIPGEMGSKLGLQIKSALRGDKSKHPIIVGLGNEWISYILPPEEYTQGGYEPGVSFYGPQLGPVMVDQAIAAGQAVLK